MNNTYCAINITLKYYVLHILVSTYVCWVVHTFTPETID